MANTIFSLTKNMEVLLEDIIAVHPVFRGIKSEKIGICFDKPKSINYWDKITEIKAQVHPIREFPLIINGVSVYYLIRFRLPTFWEGESYKARMIAIFHELFHINTECDGSVRELPSKVSLIHGNSGKVFNFFMNLFVEQYLEWTSNPNLSQFLKYPSIHQLRKEYSAVLVRCIRKKRGVNQWAVTDRDIMDLISEESI